MKKTLKLFRISQDVNGRYDTYSDAIVCATGEEEAKRIHPNGEFDYVEDSSSDFEKFDRDYGTWAKKKYVKVEYIGEAKEGMEKGVVCASFHAG